MRGKVIEAPKVAHKRRITPAHAGKSAGGVKRQEQAKDHPRSCGEKISPLRWAEVFRGSPPLMRGKAALKSKEAKERRITPAHAGKSCPSRRQCAAFGDHPRSCGEKANAGKSFLRYDGSPPLMRGKADDRRRIQRGERITPAHAGKSSGLDA